MSCLHRLFLLSSCLFPLLLRASGDVRIVEQRGERVRLLVTVEAPEVSIEAAGDAPRSRLSLDGCQTAVDDEGRALPYRSILLNLLGERPQIRLLRADEERLPMPPPLPCLETTTPNDSSQKPLPAATAIGDQVVSLRYVGEYRGSRLWSVDVFPFRYDDARAELVHYRQVLFDVIDEAAGGVPLPAAEAELLGQLGVISAAAGAKARAAAGATLAKRGEENAERWKIIVKEEGIYRITGEDLARAGVHLPDIDFKKLRLTCNGRDVSLFPFGWRDGIFDPQDYFEFWGEPNRRTFQATAPDLYQDPFTDERVYWLSWEKRGLWMAEESGQITDLQPGQFTRPYSFLETLHIEKDLYFDRLSSVEGDSMRDHWFFDTGIASGKKAEYAFELRHPDTQSPLPVTARVMLRGRTTSVEYEHNVSVFLNDSYLFSHTWPGQKIADLRSSPDTPVSAASLQNGINRLSIVNNVPPQSFDFVMLNWFEVTYPRLYRADNDFIKFSIPPGMPGGKFLFRIDGFTQPAIDVYKLHQSKINGGVVEAVTDAKNVTTLQISFQNDVFSHDVEFVAVAQSAKKKPLKIERDNPSFLQDGSRAADYLIIAHRRFIGTAPLERLIELRRSQGYTVEAVDVQDIFDEFNFGHASSFAVKEFIRYAYLNRREPKLEYVLLVGDGSYVRRTAEGDTLDLVPVHLRQTMSFGAAASDYWYSLLTGEDEIPEIAIGRLPVRTVEELERFIGKIVRYETAPPPGEWANRFLIIGGNGDDFRSQGLALSKIIPPQINTRLLFTVRDKSTNYDPYFGGTSDLLDYFSTGCSVVTFHGHGGGAIWADNGLLRYEDHNRIVTRGKTPFILSMTCFTGSFESPETESLADALLFTTDEGAVAMVGASGVGWTWNDYFLQTELMKQIFDTPAATIGRQFVAGKIAYLAHYKTSQAFSQVNQYHLLGDPAMRLHIPVGSVPVSLSESIALPGDTLKVSARLPFARGEASVALEDSLRLIVDSASAVVQDSLSAARVSIKETFHGATGWVRFFAADELNRTLVNGAATVALQGIVFDSAYVKRGSGDTLFFYTRVRSRNPLQEVVCFALNDSLPMLPLGNHWYKSARGIYVIWSGFQFSYYFKAGDGSRSVTSRLYKHYISLNVDVEIAENAVRLIGSEWVMLEATVENKSSNSVEGLEVQYRVQTLPDTTWRLVGRDSVSVDAFATALSRIRYAPPPGRLRVEVVLDPDGVVREDNKENNRAVAELTPAFFQVTPQGFMIENEVSGTLTYDDRLTVTLPAGAAQKYSALALWPLETVNVVQQPAFRHVPQTPAFHTELLNGDLLLKPATISLTVSDSVADDSLRQTWNVYSFTKKTRKWVRCVSRWEGRRFDAFLETLGPIAVFQVQDFTPPQITVAVDGQPYVEYKWVSDEPRLGIRLQDENGVDISSGQLFLALNGRPVEDAEIALPDSIIDGNQIVISYNPKLSNGEQVLTVQTTDCNGNVSPAQDYLLRVAQEFDIIMLGNYPNPFKNETRFAYLFTAPVTDMSLKIYTASGRLIRVFRPGDLTEDPNPFGADYHEILWDGADAEGLQTANGVYFYRLTARSGGKTRTVEGKVARIQ